MALLEFGERVDQDLQEALGGVPSWDPWCGLNSVTVSARVRPSPTSAL
jgi:hypothetical protein